MSLLLGLLLITSVYLLYINNTLYATLALQILIASISAILLENNVSNFFPIIYIMLYVGAIFVLFLFIIMLIHNEETKQGILNQHKIFYICLDFIVIVSIIQRCLYKIELNVLEGNKNISIFEEINNIGFIIINDQTNIYLLFTLLLFATFVPIAIYNFIGKKS